VKKCGKQSKTITLTNKLLLLPGQIWRMKLQIEVGKIYVDNNGRKWIVIPEEEWKDYQRKNVEHCSKDFVVHEMDELGNKTDEWNTVYSDGRLDRNKISEWGYDLMKEFKEVEDKTTVSVTFNNLDIFTGKKVYHLSVWLMFPKEGIQTFLFTNKPTLKDFQEAIVYKQMEMAKELGDFDKICFDPVFENLASALLLYFVKELPEPLEGEKMGWNPLLIRHDNKIIARLSMAVTEVLNNEVS
jgi:hypothetical protein